MLKFVSLITSLLFYQLKTRGARLDQWSIILKREFPDYNDAVPQIKELNIGKLDFGGAITTDTCNTV